MDYQGEAPQDLMAALLRQMATSRMLSSENKKPGQNPSSQGDGKGGMKPNTVGAGVEGDGSIREPLVGAPEDLTRYAHHAREVRRRAVAQAVGAVRFAAATSEQFCGWCLKILDRRIVSKVAKEERLRTARKLSEFRVGLLGCGRLGRGVLRALIEQKVVAASRICVSTRQPETLDDFSRAGVTCYFDNVRLVTESSVVIVCCLPEQLAMCSRLMSDRLSYVARTLGNPIEGTKPRPSQVIPRRPSADSGGRGSRMSSMHQKIEEIRFARLVKESEDSRKLDASLFTFFISTSSATPTNKLRWLFRTDFVVRTRPDLPYTVGGPPVLGSDSDDEKSRKVDASSREKEFSSFSFADNVVNAVVSLLKSEARYLGVDATLDAKIKTVARTEKLKLQAACRA